jgi:hypothetical protein
MSLVWLVDVPHAICEELNAATFGLAFEAKRSYADWSIELKDLDTLHVDVVPVPLIGGELESRSSADIELQFDIGIRKRFTGVDQQASSGRIQLDQIDELIALEQEIWIWLISRNYRVKGNTTAHWQESRILSAFSRKDLRTNRQFTGIVRSTYKIDQLLTVVHSSS